MDDEPSRIFKFVSRLLKDTAPLSGPAPKAFETMGAVVFCDISGFTSLTTEYAKRGPPGIEDLRKLLNGHYDVLISTMLRHGGDVIAIIGDAALVVFSDGPCPLGGFSDNSNKGDDDDDEDFPTITKCGMPDPSSPIGEKQNSNFPGDPILPPPPSEQITLSVHCSRAVNACLEVLASSKSMLPVHIGLACGKMQAVHVGGGQGKAQFLLLGQPFKRIQKAVDAAKQGTLCISPEVYALLSTSAGGFYGRGLVPTVLNGGFCLLTPMDTGKRQKFDLMSSPPKQQLGREMYSSRITPQQYDLLSMYLCDGVVGRFLKLKKRSDTVDWLAEWRCLSVIFVKLLIPEGLSGLSLLQILHIAFTTIQASVQAHDGTLLHAFNDDKGIIAIVIFGLPLKAHENDPSRAVACALSIHNELKKCGTKSAIGITTGHMFCGCLGCSKRMDFTVLGSLVNLAARLMSSVPLDSICPILCDEATKEQSKYHFSFSEPNYVTAKGFKDLVPSFFPTSIGRPENAQQKKPKNGSLGHLVGREEEMDRIKDMMEQWMEGYSGVVLISGDAGIGKSTFMDSSLGWLTLKFSAHKKRCAILHLNGDSLVVSDFNAWAGVFRQAICFLMSESTENVYSVQVGSMQPISQMGETFLRFLFARRFPALWPFLSLLNPFLHTHFPETPEAQALDPSARPECLYQICLSILDAVQSVCPVCIAIEDAHFLDASSWNFSNVLAKACFTQCREKESEDLQRLVSLRKNSKRFQQQQKFSSETENSAAETISVGDLTTRSLGGPSSSPPMAPSTLTFSKFSKTSFPLLIVMSSRSQSKDFRDLEGYLSFLSSDEINVIELDPLSQEGCCAMFRTLLPGVRNVSAELADFVYQRSQGNALFLRELALSMFQQNMLTVDTEGRCHISIKFSLRRDSTALFEDIPKSIDALLRSRVDSLTADQQLLIKVASVIGASFDLDTLVAIHPSQYSFAQAMKAVKEICEVGLLRLSGPNGTEISFSHQLIQEVAYAFLTPSQKLELHKKVARYLETSNDDRNSVSLGPPPIGEINNTSQQSRHLSVAYPISQGPLFHLPGQVSASSGSGGGGSAQPMSQTQYSEYMGNSNFQFLGNQRSIDDLSELFPSLAHHWSRGGVPEKARVYIDRLAERAHSNFDHREAIRWLTMLLEQEEKCHERSDPLILSKWCLYLGEAFHALGKHDMAKIWLVKALQHSSFTPPQSLLSTKMRIFEQIATQLLRNSCSFCKPKKSTVRQPECFYQQLKILRSLVVVCFFTQNAHEAIYYALYGLNLGENLEGSSNGVISVFYGFMVHMLSLTGRREWIDKYLKLALETETHEQNRLMVIRSIIPFLMWTCNPRALEELQTGLALTRSKRCWKDLFFLRVHAVYYSYHHGILSDMKEHTRALEDEARDDLQSCMFSCTMSARLALMSDDRQLAAAHIRKAITDYFEGRKSGLHSASTIPMLAAHLIFRDIHFPLPTSPHLRYSDCESILQFADLSQNPVISSPTSVVERRSSLTAHFAEDDKLLAKNTSFFGSSEIFDPTTLQNQDQTGFLKKMIESGLKNIPKKVIFAGLGAFTPLNFALELLILHNVKVDQGMTDLALKLMTKISKKIPILQPTALMWIANRDLKSDPKNSSAFLKLHESVALSQQYKLPEQEAFAHFSLAQALSTLIIHSPKLKSEKITKITKCYPPFDTEIQDRFGKGRLLLHQSGHTFYENVFSEIQTSISSEPAFSPRKSSD